MHKHVSAANYIPSLLIYPGPLNIPQTLKYILIVEIYPPQTLKYILIVEIYPPQTLKYILIVKIYPTQTLKYILIFKVCPDPLQMLRVQMARRQFPISHSLYHFPYLLCEPYQIWPEPLHRTRTFICLIFLTLPIFLILP